MNIFEDTKRVLGKKVKYTGHYDHKLLHAIDRYESSDIRKRKVYGFDIWNAYELSWLNQNGMPKVAIAKIIVPIDTQKIVESKSMKLYLNSFNDTTFDSSEQVASIITKDLVNILKNDIKVEIYDFSLSQNDKVNISSYNDEKWELLDTRNLSISWTNIQTPRKDLIKLNNDHLVSHEKDAIKKDVIVYSNLLKSNCLITNQPDFATIVIKYNGVLIDHDSLLRYIVSFRHHNAFHEKCIDTIYSSIMDVCDPKELLVHAHYTRRGGIDICPYRSSYPISHEIYERFIRQ